MKLTRCVSALTLPALTLLALTGIAPVARAADPVEGFYVGAGAGLDLAPSERETVEPLPGQKPLRDALSWDPGAVGVASIGYGFGNGLRLELEGDVRFNDQGHNADYGGGQRLRYGAMANVLFDVDVGLDWMQPYIGVGGGWQQTDWRHVGLSAASGGGTIPASVNQSLGSLAWQVMVGAAFPIPDAPGLSLTAEYRYMSLAGSRKYRAATSAGTTRVRAGDEADHTLLLGLRYALETQESEPVAPLPRVWPAEEAPLVRTYLVFFDWDRADLSQRARDIIGEAVRNSTRIPHTRIEVTGHADNTGTPAYNQQLSLRRAQAVTAELELRGVPANIIMVHAVGDTRPLLPTAANTREPQNRVVEIVLN